MRSGVHIRLPARQEGNAWHRGRHAIGQALHGHLGHFLAARLRGAIRAGNDHVGFQDRAFQHHALIEQFRIKALQSELGHLVAAVDIMVAIHDDFRLHDGNNVRFLAQHRIARERVHVRVDAVLGRHAVIAARTDIDHGAPFGKTRAQRMILRQTLAQTVEALGDHLARRASQRFRARIHLDARHGARLGDQLGQRRAVLGFLAQCLVIEDDAGYMLAHRRLGTEQHFAPVPAAVGGRFQLDRVKALLDRAGGLVCRQNALAGRHHAHRGFVERVDIHSHIPP